MQYTLLHFSACAATKKGGIAYLAPSARRHRNDLVMGVPFMRSYHRYGTQHTSVLHTALTARLVAPLRSVWHAATAPQCCPLLIDQC